MLPTTISNQRAAWGVFQRDTSSSERETDRQTAEGSSNEKKESDSCRGDGVLVMKFLKNSIVDNPIIVSMLEEWRGVGRERERELHINRNKCK